MHGSACVVHDHAYTNGVLLLSRISAGTAIKHDAGCDGSRAIGTNNMSTESRLTHYEQ